MDTVRVISSVYAAFASVRPIKLKSMTPFPGYSNRHASIEGGAVVTVVIDVVAVVTVVVVVVAVVVVEVMSEQPFQQAHLCVKRNIRRFPPSALKTSKFDSPVVEHCNITVTASSPFA